MGNQESAQGQRADSTSKGASGSRTGNKLIRQGKSVDEHLSEDKAFQAVATTLRKWHADQIARKTSNSPRSQQQSHDNPSDPNHSPSASGIPAPDSLSLDDLGPENPAIPSSDSLFLDDSGPENPAIPSSDARHLCPADYAEVNALQYVLGPTLEDFQDQVDGVVPVVDIYQSYMEQIISLQQQADAAWASMSDNAGFRDESAIHARMPRPLIHLTRWEGSIMDWRKAQYTDGLGLWDILDSDDDEEKEGEGKGDGKADVKGVEEIKPRKSSAQSGWDFKVYEDLEVHDDPLPDGEQSREEQEDYAEKGGRRFGKEGNR
ncbi:MAG: hypothetical protein LQ351_003731 [Letrouitia transgressa]|nr:MAG: hypothetical protein LQ351_003731 [Letrouitia transgressa]